MTDTTYELTPVAAIKVIDELVTNSSFFCNCDQQLHESNINQRENVVWPVFIHFILKAPDE